MLFSSDLKERLSAIFHLCLRMRVMKAGRIRSTSPPHRRNLPPHTEEPTPVQWALETPKKATIQTIRCTHQIPISKAESHTHTRPRHSMKVRGGNCHYFCTPSKTPKERNLFKSSSASAMRVACLCPINNDRPELQQRPSVMVLCSDMSECTTADKRRTDWGAFV